MPSAGNNHVGMRSVGAGGFPRSRVQMQTQNNNMLSDVDVNSHISAPFYAGGVRAQSNGAVDN